MVVSVFNRSYIVWYYKTTDTDKKYNIEQANCIIGQQNNEQNFKLK